MVKKLGDVAIALVILSFVVVAFSSFIEQADVSEGVISGDVRNSLRNLSLASQGATGSLTNDFQASFDDTNDVEIDVNQQLATAGDSSSGLLNILSKNVLVKFFNAASTSLSDFQAIFVLLSTLVGITITILIIRFFRGDGKI